MSIKVKDQLLSTIAGTHITPSPQIELLGLELDNLPRACLTVAVNIWTGAHLIVLSK